MRFIQNRYGAERVPGGFLHLDETTPHLHVPVIPTLDGKLMGSKVINRADLQTFHSELSRAVEEALGVHVSIELDESQKAKKELSHLDQPTYKAAIREIECIQTELAVLRAERDGLERAVAELKKKVRELKNHTPGRC